MNTAKQGNEHHESPWAFTFADRLGKALHVSGVSNQDMADALGVSRATVSNYTSGRTAPSKLQIKEWALKTGAPIEWIKTGIDPTENPHQSPDGGNVGPAGFDPTTSTVKTWDAAVTSIGDAPSKRTAVAA